MTELLEAVRRARSGQVTADHLISFMFVDAFELDWAECWYIGTLRPRLNFGVNAAHRHAEN
ncbi:MAG: hypothetical protein IH604_16290 [Burkholderiales bacterium]|nr:hypothetical protein [Burkholderiales bacterium]